MKLELKPEQIAYPNGLEIAVEGFAGDAGRVKPSQLFIEVHDSTLKVDDLTGISNFPETDV